MGTFSTLRLTLAVLCIAIGYGSESGSSSCKPEVSGVRFTCPAGWSILNQDHAHPGEITIGDFRQSSDERMKNVIPAGKNTITILPKPALYATLEEWISATEHLASDEKETTEIIATDSDAKIKAHCFSRDPAPRKPGDLACIITIGGNPIMLDLFISPKATDVEALRRNLHDMIATAKP